MVLIFLNFKSLSIQLCLASQERIVSRTARLHRIIGALFASGLRCSSFKHFSDGQFTRGRGSLIQQAFRFLSRYQGMLLGLSYDIFLLGLPALLFLDSWLVISVVGSVSMRTVCYIVAIAHYFCLFPLTMGLAYSHTLFLN